MTAAEEKQFIFSFWEKERNFFTEDSLSKGAIYFYPSEKGEILAELFPEALKSIGSNCYFDGKKLLDAIQKRIAFYVNESANEVANGWISILGVKND